MIIERGRPGEHPKGTSDHVTSRGTPTGDVISGQKTNRKRSLLPVAHARTHPSKGTPWGSRDV
jgi:hypothetical protein